MKKLVIGLTGQPSSGKDTVANYLTTLGFVHVPTSDLIREEMRALGLPLDRSSLSQFVVEKRKERGPGYLALQAIKKIEELDSPAVISGYRNVSEVEISKNKFRENFIMLAVEAPIETRYKWASGRGRAGDSISFEQFKKEEDNERSGDPNTHQVDNVIKMADEVVLNDGSKEDLLRKIDIILSRFNYER